MKIRCPKCKRAVPADQVNMGSDLAYCPDCNNGFKISETVDKEKVNSDFLRSAPAGAWFNSEWDKAVVGASTRSPSAFYIVPFMIVWTVGALGGIYGSQVASGQFDPVDSFFGIPFILGSIIFGAAALMTVFGKVEVSIGRESSVFTGIGPLGWTRRFDWSAVQTIREADAQFGYFGSQSGAIVMEGKTRLKFGTGLNEERRYFVLNVLRHLQQQRR